LSQDAYSFFKGFDLHDGELFELRLIDGSRPAPLSAPARPWKTVMSYPVNVRLAVLDATDQFLWHLSYSNVRRVVIDYPSDEKLFYQQGEGFGDWGYHELTDAGNCFLRHEVLFRSGSALIVEFKDFDITKRVARDGSTGEAGDVFDVS
jgi:hypothetical protein